MFLANAITNTPTVYEWYAEKPSGDLELVASTSTPNLVINNTTHIHSGTYMVRSKSEGCISNFSNSQSVIVFDNCLLYTSPSPRDQRGSRMPSSA